MLDDPRGVDILASVSRLMRDFLIPKLPPDAVFQARVAANAIDLVVRELRDGERLESESRKRLQQLLGRDGPLPDLEAGLSELIRRGAIDLDSPDLLEHLWLTTMAKMSIDQPAYASYRRELARGHGNDAEGAPAASRPERSEQP